MKISRLLSCLACSAYAFAATVDDCPGYTASNIQTSSGGLTADLKLAGDACNVYGYDVGSLKLTVETQTDARLHVKITDSEEKGYEIPESVLPRPKAAGGYDAGSLKFTYTEKPFSFAVQRKDGDIIFNTNDTDLIYESQYIRLRTSLPDAPNIFGLGEHTDPFKLGNAGYRRTLWSRDAYEIPRGTNLYGNHPVYFETRGGQTHGVFFANSNGMDINIDTAGGQHLDYNILGGVIDLYFLAGPSPSDIAKQYSEVVGLPALIPYWGLGFHQCRYGYQDIYEVAGVVANYSAAKIPLETMWTDIDYMDKRKVFSLDGERFALDKVQSLVSYLHDHDQHYVMMVDPAVAYADYPAFNNGKDVGAFMTNADGSVYKGVVWPGVTAFPDWFAPNTQSYWNKQIETFFSKDTGIDIDGLWIDMNEAANFCSDPCDDADGYASANGFPPPPPPVRGSPAQLPGLPSNLQPSKFKRQDDKQSIGLPNRDFLTPPYAIHNAAGSLSNKTLSTSLIHAGEKPYAEYDTHNLYGTMMSSASRTAMLARRPSVRPLVITRSTFAGAGRHVGHWQGDNAATWEEYRFSISQQLQFTSLYQIPMVGSDVCGYARVPTEKLCARWAMLGAFSTFYRNHAETGKPGQEFYRWETVAEAARKAIDIRYRLLDYIYTALARQSRDGTPAITPLFFAYPEDTNTYAIDTSFLYGPSLLVSPVVDEDSTEVDVYLPKDTWYEFHTYHPVAGEATSIHLSDVDFTTIPLHIRGGSIIPLRTSSAATTKEVRGKDFSLLVAPGVDGKARGELYLDDGESLVQASTLEVEFEFDGKTLTVEGKGGYEAGVKVVEVDVLGQKRKGKPDIRGAGKVEWDEAKGVVKVEVDIGLGGKTEVGGF